ncbi:MAG: leucine-rich repeat domain-containing protein [Ruminococcaceae bacterium]|nr:leucine-rich repeat domain-containing protein [Oscillospiraceae bacterium]
MSNNKKDNFIIDIISGIDRSIIDKHLIKRFKLWDKKGNASHRKAIISVCAAAACFLFLFTTVFIFIINGKQVPVYTGMTVSNSSPITPDAASIEGRSGISFLSASEYHVSILGEPEAEETSNTETKENTSTDTSAEEQQSAEQAVDSVFPVVEGAIQEYYAKKNEDIYILIHIDNPDDFEILSFTLNGVKYASHMFEDGSTLETLILKYNVGDVQGVQQYTIDAIKYVDGDRIKDVRMSGEKTVTVNITPEAQPTVTVNSDVVGFNHLALDVSVTDTLGLIKGEDKLHAVLLDGETVVQKVVLTEGRFALFSGLVSNKTYTYTVVAVYDAIDGQGEVAHVLLSKNVTTVNAVEFNTKNDGWNLTISPKWHKVFPEGHTFESLALYDGDTKLRDLAIDTTVISDMPYAKTLTLVGTYKYANGTHKVECDFTSPATSAGLNISNGKVVGIGNCNDTVIYIDMPVSANAFENQHHIKEIHLGPNAKMIGDSAFKSCSSIRYVSINGDNTILNSGAFANCTSLKSISLRGKILSIEASAFENCTRITELVIPKNVVTRIEAGAFKGCNSISSLTLPFLGETRVDEGNEYIGHIFGAISYSKQSAVVPTALKKVVITGGSSIDYWTAFYKCQHIEDITLPASMTDFVTHNTNMSFENKLKNISLLGENSKYKIDGNCLILKSSNALLLGTANSIIPSYVTSIDPNAFTGNTLITAVTIPNNVTVITDSMFEGCASLSSVVLHQNITSIGARAFMGCSSLQNITLPSGITEIADHTFDGCHALTSINIPVGVTRIGDSAFAKCSLIDVVIPANVKNIGKAAFYQSDTTPTLTSVTFIEPNGWSAYDALTNTPAPFDSTVFGTPSDAAAHLGKDSQNYYTRT